MIYKRRMRLPLLIFASVLALSACSGGETADPVYKSWVDRKAVGGYDLVSFFSGKPLIGNENYQTEYRNATWSFSSRANMELFKTNPEAFMPQYGGYCAWAMAQGKLAKGSPENWHVRDGRLYFNYNARIQAQWERDIPGFIRQANENWPRFANDPSGESNG